MRTILNSAKHILVVDDDEAVREALVTGLGFTYVVHAAATGDEASTVLQRYPIAGIVLDEVLGKEHGLNFVSGFRALCKGPILLMTGHSTEELAICAIWAGVDGYLKKPVKLQEILAALDRVIEDTEPVPDLATKVRHLLNENPEKWPTTATVARAVGLSRRHLHRQFREAHGKTPGRFLTELRLQRAAELLRTTQLPVKQVASAVG
jgi:DNA-binding response OmpR family regulator